MVDESSATAQATPGQRARSLLALPPWALVVIAVVSVQTGAATAKQLFDTVGPAGVVFLRTSLAALMFLAVWRPSLRLGGARNALYLVVYGVNIAVMMLVFYASISLVPLGVAVAVAFAGPLVVAVAGSRRALDLVWVALAAAGILLLSPLTNVSLNPLGIVLSLLSAGTWASYILLSRRITQMADPNRVLALAMGVAALVALPFGIGGAVRVLESPSLIGLALVVAVLSSAIPFALEFEALKRLRPAVFGLLVSLEPVVASLIGFLLLREALGLTELAGIVMVTVAAIGTARTGGNG